MRRLYALVAIIGLNSLVLFFAVNAVAAIALRIIGDPPEEQSEYHRRQPWGEQMFRESASLIERFEPYVIWKESPFQGQLIRIDKDGNRETPGSACGAGAYTVLVLGGSTIWGDGVPDWGTIPAYLQTTLHTRLNRPVCVKNLGQPAWVSTQGVIELLRRLQSGERPDLVISYDGYNEVTARWDQGMPGIPQGVDEFRARFAGGRRYELRELARQMPAVVLAQRLAPRRWTSREPPGITSTAADAADGVVRVYLINYEIVGAMAARFGFSYAFFWQPALSYTRRPLLDGERPLLDGESRERPGMREFLRDVYERVRRETAGRDRLFFLGDAFETGTQPVYIDSVHLTTEANALIATLMIEALQPGGARAR